MSQTATNTLAKKSRSDDVISGGHLVAKALRNEGVDPIFTLCGGHIIDIYDGCIDEGIRIIESVMNKRQHSRRRLRQTNWQAGLCGDNSGSRLYKSHDGIATAFRSESPVLHIGVKVLLLSIKWVLKGPSACRDDDPKFTKFAAGVMSTERVADMISRARKRMLFRGIWPQLFWKYP
ncbi:MAG: hypothetical protein CM1200mP30_26200 [Pseudomonadota bacterium]|nr:MAG: hypothetical protein CM1200mP30_26200 [Pseudomonadota bacterium]